VAALLHFAVVFSHSFDSFFLCLGAISCLIFDSLKQARQPTSMPSLQNQTRRRVAAEQIFAWIEMYYRTFDTAVNFNIKTAAAFAASLSCSTTSNFQSAPGRGSLTRLTSLCRRSPFVVKYHRHHSAFVRDCNKVRQWSPLAGFRRSRSRLLRVGICISRPTQWQWHCTAQLMVDSAQRLGRTYLTNNKVDSSSNASEMGVTPKRPRTDCTFG